jgi:hypothetical protein
MADQLQEIHKELKQQ